MTATRWSYDGLPRIAGDAELLEIADEVVDEVVVRNGQSVGRAGLVGVIAAIRAAMPDFHTEIEDLIAEDDRVAWRYSSGGTHTGGPLFGVPASAKSINWTGTAILRLDDGVIKEIWDNVDMLAIYAQLGLVPDATDRNT